MLENKYEENKQIVRVLINSKIYLIVVPLIGYFQIKNLLMAILAANCCGLSYKKIFSKINKIRQVPGRLEYISKLKEKFSNDLEIYNPKFRTKFKMKNKIIINELSLLGDYLFCYHEKFLKFNFSLFQYIKGLKYCLSNRNSRQEDILDFVNICKKYQDNDGCLRQEFFNCFDFKKGIFLTGPLANMFFDLVEKHKNKLKVTVGNLSVVINKKTNCLYQPT